MKSLNKQWLKHWKVKLLSLIVIVKISSVSTALCAHYFDSQVFMNFKHQSESSIQTLSQRQNKSRLMGFHFHCVASCGRMDTEWTYSAKKSYPTRDFFQGNLRTEGKFFPWVISVLFCNSGSTFFFLLVKIDKIALYYTLNSAFNPDGDPLPHTAVTTR